MFEQYNYAGAREKLGEIKEEIPDPVIRQELNFVYSLAQIYEYWDSLEFISAYKTISNLVRGIDVTVNTAAILYCRIFWSN